MNSNKEPRWHRLSHAYGQADDIPEILDKARTDLRPGHVPDSAWFALWSALCHQGDVYSASYMALPILIEMARLPAYNCRYDPLLLAAHIERGRIEGRGPAIPTELVDTYTEAIAIALKLSAQNSSRCTDADSVLAFKISHAIFSGDLAAADELDADA